MKTFSFYQDIKISMWQRQFFEIEAETLEEAKKTAMHFVDSDVANSEFYDSSEYLFDTEEYIENIEGNSCTIELYVNGDKKPFATNAKIPDNSELDEQAEYVQLVIKEWLDGITPMAVKKEDEVIYHFYQVDNKLAVIANHDNKKAIRYEFSESWNNIILNNQDFRRKMMNYIFSKRVDEFTVFSVHDWLAGHLTEIKHVPFSTSEFIHVWGRQAEISEKKNKIIGWQIFNDEGQMPDGLFSFQIIKNAADAERRLADALENQPELKGLFIHPIYKGDIEEPSFI